MSRLSALPGWKATRRRILERDGYRCRIPGCTDPRPADSVDHVIPRALGGGHGDHNLRAAHGRCNSRIGGGLAARRRRPPLPRARASRW